MSKPRRVPAALPTIRRKACPHADDSISTPPSTPTTPRSSEHPGTTQLSESRIFLQTHGYRLLFEDKVDDPRHFLYDALDAVRIQDGQPVTLKSVLLSCEATYSLHDFSQLRDTASLQIVAIHHTSPGGTENSLPAFDHRLPVQRVLSHPRYPGYAFLVYPRVQPFEPLSDLKTVDDVATLVIQLLEGLAFLHKQGKRQSTLSRQNLIRTTANVHRTLSGQPGPSYYFAPKKDRRPKTKQPGSVDTSDDIYQLGKLLKWNILNRFTGHHRLASLVATMLDPVPQRRPSASEALHKYKQHALEYTPQKLGRLNEMRALEGIAPDSFDFLRFKGMYSPLRYGRRLSRRLLDVVLSPASQTVRSASRRVSRSLSNRSTATRPSSPSLRLHEYTPYEPFPLSPDVLSHPINCKVQELDVYLGPHLAQPSVHRSSSSADGHYIKRSVTYNVRRRSLAFPPPAFPRSDPAAARRRHSMGAYETRGHDTLASTGLNRRHPQPRSDDPHLVDVEPRVDALRL